MSADLIELARAGDEAAFAALVEPHRRRLLMHCYQILGSLHEAEDALQETLLAAWRGLAAFEGRSSVATWLYRIATNRSLNMLRAGTGRPEPEAHAGEVQLPEPTRIGEMLWLEPFPDALGELAEAAPGPEARYEAREAISLAFVIALQLLPPRQRAVLLLRDVLGFRAKEVARLLDSTEESVTSALKRARAALEERLPRRDEHAPARAPRSAAEAELVERFTRAFESSDIDGVVALLTEDVSFTMPPLPFEWEGRDRARLFLRAMWTTPVRRLIGTRANGQPAFALYLPGPHGDVLYATGLLVLTLAAQQISAITRFDNSGLSSFGLPRTLPTEP